MQYVLSELKAILSPETVSKQTTILTIATTQIKIALIGE